MKGEREAGEPSFIMSPHRKGYVEIREYVRE